MIKQSTKMPSIEINRKSSIEHHHKYDRDEHINKHKEDKE